MGAETTCETTMTPRTHPPASTAEGTRQDGRWSGWLWLTVAAAGVAAIGNVAGLTDTARIYGQESTSLVQQAVAQDLVNLVLVVPLLVGLAVRTAHGSWRARPVLFGALLYTVYNYVIYAFAIHFGPLFLLWVAVLGLATFALIGGVAAVHPRSPSTSRLVRLTGWFLIVVAILFGLLWLADIVPALRTGTAPASAVELGLPTNPVHVLDLAFLLPAALVIGVGLLRHRPQALAFAPALLLFLALTGAPILVTPFVAVARGEVAEWGATGPVGLVTAASLGLLATRLRPDRASTSARPQTPLGGQHDLSGAPD